MELEKRTPGKRRIYAVYISKRTGKRADRRYIICGGPKPDLHDGKGEKEKWWISAVLGILLRSMIKFLL